MAIRIAVVYPIRARNSNHQGTKDHVRTVAEQASLVQPLCISLVTSSRTPDLPINGRGAGASEGRRHLALIPE